MHGDGSEPAPGLLAPACCSLDAEQRLSEGVRREVIRRLSPTRLDLPTVSLDLTWEWTQERSAPGSWIEEPCLPQPSFDTPPILTDIVAGFEDWNRRAEFWWEQREYKHALVHHAGAGARYRRQGRGASQRAFKRSGYQSDSCSDAGWRPLNAVEP